jgi:cytochrome c-type biogenesis protein CcmF
VQGIKVTVGPPFFNQVNVPIGLLLILLAGVGPLLAWRKGSIKLLRKIFVYPIGVAVVSLAVLVAFGVRHVYAVLAFSLCIFMIATIVLEYYRGISARVRNQGEGVFAAAWELTMRNKRRFGGYIVHFGIAVLFIGVAASSAYQMVGEVRLGIGESFAMNNFRLRYEGVRGGRNSQYQSSFARLSVYKGGHFLGEIEPEKRIYFTPPQPTTEAGIRYGLSEDVYAVFAEVDRDGSATFKFLVNPLIMWVWFGGYIIVIGTFVCFLPERWGRRRKAQPAGAEA